MTQEEIKIQARTVAQERYPQIQNGWSLVTDRKQRSLMSTYCEGAEWAREQIIQEACEWLKANIKIGFHDEVKPFMVESAFTDEFVEVFRKSMKGE